MFLTSGKNNLKRKQVFDGGVAQLVRAAES